VDVARLQPVIEIVIHGAESGGEDLFRGDDLHSQTMINQRSLANKVGRPR
jgi:hypothetical protein